MTCKEYYNKIKNIELEKIKELAVEQNAKNIVELNQSQLQMGVTIHGNIIDPQYSELYLKRKLRLSSYHLSGTPDLYLNGDLYKGMDVDVIDRNGQWNVISWDEKADVKTRRYKDLFGLTDENIEKAKIFCTITLNQLIKQQINN